VCSRDASREYWLHPLPDSKLRDGIEIPELLKISLHQVVMECLLLEIEVL